jgi:dihydrofolate synthase/folylpolyglutamate synthase
VCARQHEAAAAVIDEACARAEAPLIRAGREWDGYLHHGRLVVQTATRLFDLSPPCLIGAHQLDNAALAAAAMTTWGDARISEEALSEGVSTARWPGRMTRVRSTAHEIWIDGAHNPHGARALGATLAHLQAGAPKPVVMICGVFANKNCDEIVTTLAPNADYFIAVPVSGARASAEPSHLVELARPFAPVVEPAATLDVAIARATQLSPNARVIICGSLHLAGQALHLYSEI